MEYVKVDDAGYIFNVAGEPQVLAVDNVIICAGQVPLFELKEALENANQKVHLVGGAKNAKGLDAKRAIKEAAYLVAEM